MHALVSVVGILALLAASAGCSKETSGLARSSTDESTATDGGDGVSRDASVLDAATVPQPWVDAGEPDAAGPGLPGDAGARDAAAVDLDAATGAFDASAPLDAGEALDAGTAMDAGTAVDAGDARDAGLGEPDASLGEDAGGIGGDAGPGGPFRCPGRELVGDVEIRSADALAALDGIVCIRGALSFSRGLAEMSAPPSGAIPDLRFVFGDVSYDLFDRSEPPLAAQLEYIEGTLSLGTRRPVQLPALASTGGLIISGAFGRPTAAIELPELREIRGDIRTNVAHEASVVRLPVLERVGGSLNIQNASTLRELSAPNLRVLEGDFQVRSASSMEQLAFPALERARSVLISGNGPTDTLRTIDLSALVDVSGRLSITSRSVEQIRLSSLRQVGGMLSMARLDRLAMLELPALVSAGSLLIDNAALLSALGLPSLSTVSFGAISRCPMLSECVVAALNAQLAPESGRIRAAGLRNDPACAPP